MHRADKGKNVSAKLEIVIRNAVNYIRKAEGARLRQCEKAA